MAVCNGETDFSIDKYLKREFNYKIVVIGDFGVGKTSIINRYSEGEFTAKYKVTIGSDFAQKTIEWDEDTRINLQIWDVAGHERFSNLTGVFYKHADAALVVFDLTRPETFNSVDKWLEDLRYKVRQPGGKTIPVILLANKGDVTVATIPPEIESYCKAKDILAWFITSAKNNIQIDEAMIKLINSIINNQFRIEFSSPDSEDNINLKNGESFNNTNGNNWRCFNT